MTNIAKGDIIVGDGKGGADFLAVGATTGHVLKVNPAATLGVEWGATSGTATFTGPFDYYVYKDGSTYYAKNEQTGVVDYSGSTFTTVMASVLGAKSGCAVKLAASTTFSVSAGGLQIYDSANNGARICGANEYTTILEAAGSCTTGVVDVRAQNVVLDFLTIDGNAQTSTVGLCVGSQGDESRTAYHCSFQNLIIKDCPTAGIQIWDDVNYVNFDNIKVMDSLVNYGLEFRGDTYSNYNNGQINFYNCIIAGPVGAVRRSWTSGGTMKGVSFFGCDFQGGDSGTYQVDCTGIYNLLFDRCIFETATAGKASTSQIRLDSYGVVFNECSFAHRALGTQTFVTNGTSYAGANNAGYVFISPKIYNSAVGDTTFNISAGTIIGTSRESVSGTVYSATTLANCTIIDPNHTYEFQSSGNGNFLGSIYINGHQALTDPTASPTNKFLRDDGTWQTVSGTGDVVGPASATANAIARYDGTTGKLIKDSSVTVADTTGSLVPAADNTGSLGSATNGWGRLYLGASTSYKIQAGGTVEFRNMADSAYQSIYVNTIGVNSNIQTAGVTVINNTQQFTNCKALTPDADNTRNIGSATLGFGKLYLGAATSAKILAGLAVAFRNTADSADQAITTAGITASGQLTLSVASTPIVLSGATDAKILVTNASGLNVRNSGDTTGAPISCSTVNCTQVVQLGGSENQFTGTIQPGNTDATYDLGKSSYGWANLFLGSATSAKIRAGLAVQFRNHADSAYQAIDVLSLSVGGSAVINSSGIITNQVVSINFVIDGGGATITTGKKGVVVVPFAMTVTGWDIIADQSGSIVVDVNRSTYSGFPSTSSIAGSELPTLSSVQKNQDLSLSTWTTSIAAGDVLEFEVDSITTCQRVTVAIRGTRA